MPGGISRKWRPSLGLVLGLTVASVLCLPLGGIIVISLLFPVIGYQQSVLIVSVGVLVLAGALAWVMWRLLLGPITTLAARAEGVTRNEPGALDPLPHYGTQEMERLGRVVIDMGRVLMGREAVLRSYADHATHELKSPLTVLRGATELLEIDGLPPEDRSRLIGRIDAATERMSSLLEAQRALARAQEPMLDGWTRAASLMDELRGHHGGLDLALTSDGDLPLSREGALLVLDHLLSNAAAVGATRVEIAVGQNVIEVADNGPGVSEGNRTRIFDPFFTTRRATGGTGMGLPIVRRMLEAHGATIALVDPPQGGGLQGARFRIGF